jgi:hypothetical protein
MKTECVIKSVKTDSKDVLLYVGAIVLIGILGWAVATNSETVLTTLRSFGTAISLAIICSIIIDAVCIKLATFPEKNSDPSTKPAPLWWTLGVYTIFYGLIILLYYLPSGNAKYPDLTAGFAINTAFVILMCIAARVWVRCSKEETKS